MLRVILAIALAWMVTACSAVGSEPTTELIGQAIALQLSQTQQQLSQQLRLSSVPEAIQVKHIKVTQQTPLKIQNLPSYRVKGTCDFTLKQAKHAVSQQKTPFEVYLQRQPEGKTWRVAYLKADQEGKPIWFTQPLASELVQPG